MKHPKHKVSKVRATPIAQESERDCPLFPSLKQSQVDCIRVSEIDGDDYLELEADLIEPYATEDDLFNLYASLATHEAHLFLEAITRDPQRKIVVVQEREIHLAHRDAAPTRKGCARVKARDHVEIPQRKRPKENGAGTIVADRDSMVVPAGVTVDQAQTITRENAILGLAENYQRSFLRVVELNQRTAIEGVMTALRESIGSGLNDERIRDLKEQLSEVRADRAKLEAQMQEMRSDFMRERSKVELEVIQMNRKHAQEVFDLQAKVRRAEQDLDEERAETRRREGVLRELLTNAAIDNGPAIIQSILAAFTGKKAPAPGQS